MGVSQPRAITDRVGVTATGGITATGHADMGGPRREWGGRGGGGREKQQGHNGVGVEKKQTREQRGREVRRGGGGRLEAAAG